MSDNDVIVDIQNLGKWFDRRCIFENISLQVRQGEVVAIIGPSGTGKSTLIRCINYLTSFESGLIQVAGHKLEASKDKRKPSKNTLRDIRTNVGMVFQNFNLFQHMSVLENIVVGPMEVKKIPRNIAEDEAMGLLEKVGLPEKAKMYPKRLSGGEQQRVAICRALAMKPKVMLLDEPTSALDPELVGEVLATIQSIAQEGMTMILVTHEMMFAKEVADTIVIMADGSIVEKGSPKQILENPKTKRAQSFLNRVIYHATPQSLSPPEET